VSEALPESRDVSDVQTLAKSLGLLDRLPVIDTHKVGIMYAGPGQTSEVDILRNTHGSQAYTRFLDGIGKLVHLRSEKDFYTGSLDPDEDGEYAYAWGDDIKQILFHTATLMPTHEHDSNCNNKKRHIGNDYVRIVWNDSGKPYAFDTLSTAFQFVNIVIEPHSIGTISAFSNDAHENEYFRVIVQTAEGMTECTPVGQFKIVSAVVLPHFVRHVSIFADRFTSIFSSTGHDTQRNEVKTNWAARLDAMERFQRQTQSAAPETVTLQSDSALST
jgi:tuberous sclerosis 2